jgi:hypothetical protein
MASNLTKNYAVVFKFSTPFLCTSFRNDVTIKLGISSKILRTRDRHNIKAFMINGNNLIRIDVPTDLTCKFYFSSFSILTYFRGIVNVTLQKMCDIGKNG